MALTPKSRQTQSSVDAMQERGRTNGRYSSNYLATMGVTDETI